MDLRETYNLIAKDWHKDHTQDNWWVDGTDKFVSFLKKGDSVLDVGCGAGAKSKYLSEKGLKVTGIDFSEEMIKIAKREVPSAIFKVLDLAQVGILPTSFDGIFVQAVLLHIPKEDAERQIANMTEKLKSGGYLYIAVKEKWPNGADEEIKIENDYGYSYQRFFSYFTSSELKRYCINSGLTIIYESVSLSGKTNWIQVIAQKD